jgi:hypothetical protein
VLENNVIRYKKFINIRSEEIGKLRIRKEEERNDLYREGTRHVTSV